MDEQKVKELEKRLVEIETMQEWMNREVVRLNSLQGQMTQMDELRWGAFETAKKGLGMVLTLLQGDVDELEGIRA